MARAVPQQAEGAAGRRPPLELVAPRTRRVRRRRVAPLVAASVLSASLLLVVVGHAELAEGQVRLTDVQSEVTSAQVLHRREVLALATLEDPSRILQMAESILHMAPPSQVDQLAHVPLGVPVPAPHVVPATGGAPTSQAASGA